jgi:hypothetical protein
MTEDPELARSFTALAEVPPPAGRSGTSADGPAVVTVIVTLLLGVPLLLAGSPLGALAIAVLPGLLWLLWRQAHRTADRP